MVSASLRCRQGCEQLSRASAGSQDVKVPAMPPISKQMMGNAFPVPQGTVLYMLLSSGPHHFWSDGAHPLYRVQVLVSIQSLILVEDPYFNEPGTVLARQPHCCLIIVHVAGNWPVICVDAPCCQGIHAPSFLAGFESSMHDERGKKESAKYDLNIR